MKAEEGIASKPSMYYDVGYTYPILHKNISKALLILPSSRSRPIIWCVSSEAFWVVFLTLSIQLGHGPPWLWRSVNTFACQNSLIVFADATKKEASSILNFLIHSWSKKLPNLMLQVCYENFVECYPPKMAATVLHTTSLSFPMQQLFIRPQ